MENLNLDLTALAFEYVIKNNINIEITKEALDDFVENNKDKILI